MLFCGEGLGKVSFVCLAVGVFQIGFYVFHNVNRKWQNYIRGGC
jgi:hypothetical protein